MPFVYAVVPAPSTALATHGTPNTENPNLVLRQATRGFDINMVQTQGLSGALSTLSGILFRARRWTTAGSGGTAVTPAPRRIGTTASTTAASSETTITPGTTSGAYQWGFGMGAAGPGGWTARDPDSACHVEGGGSDEISINSLSPTASLPLSVTAEIAE